MLLIVLLVGGGLALAAMGGLALRRKALTAMPSWLAVAVVLAGAGVVAFGLSLPRLEREPAPEARTVPLEPVPHDVQANESIRVEVRGSVRTLGGEPVTGATAALGADGEVVDEVVTTDDGTFAFTGIEVTGFPYEVLVDHDGATFTSQPFGVDVDEVVVEVAPTTGDPAAVGVRAASIAVVGDEEGVQVVHAFSIENRGQEAYVGGVTLPLLPGAALIEPQRGLSLRQMVAAPEGGLRGELPVLPGTTELAYTYFAPLPRGGLDLTYEATLPTARFDALIGEGLEVAGAGVATEPVTLGGRRYESSSWRDLAAGDVVEATISVPEAPSAFRVAAIGIAALLAMAVVAIPLVRRRSRGTPA